MNPLLQTAEYLCRLGIRVFPIRYQSKEPHYKGLDWRAYAINNPAQISSLFRLSPSNLAVVLGPSSGILDFEIDSEQGRIEFEQLEAIYGETPTISYQSRRGIHRWFRWDPRLMDLGKAVVKWRGFELRLGTEAKGAYSAVPPSLHPDGMYYNWLPGRAPWEVPLAPFPEYLVHLYLGAERHKTSRSVVEVGIAGDDFIPEPGQRHAYALRLSHLLHGQMRLPKDLSIEMMKVFNHYVGKDDEVGDREIENMVSTIQRPPLLSDDPFAEIDFAEMYEAAKNLHVAEKKIEIAKAPPMPRVFPGWLENMGDHAWRCQIPRHFWMMMGLTSISAAVGATVTIQAAEDAPETGLQIYTMGVGDSGSGKSRALKQALRPFVREPWFVTDTTSEALTRLMSKHHRGILMKIAEGKQFSKMMGRYNANTGDVEGSNNSVLCEAWSGDTISVVRQDDRKCIRVEHPCLTVAATIQTHNLRSFGVDDIMEGLMQRLLVFGADPIPEEVNRESAHCLEAMMTPYTAMVQRLQQIRPDLGNDLVAGTDPNEDAARKLLTEPLRLVLDPDAEALWTTYAKFKRSDDQLDMYPESHPFRADLMRHAEYVLRIAGCFYLGDYAFQQTTWDLMQFSRYTRGWVPAVYVRNAIDLMEWLWLQKQQIMEDIVEDRFAKALPQQPFRNNQTLSATVRKFAQRREKTLLHRLKGPIEWTARDYYRLLRLETSAAQQEIDYFQKAGLVHQCGVRGRSPIFRFQIVEEENPSRPE